MTAYDGIERRLPRSALVVSLPAALGGTGLAFSILRPRIGWLLAPASCALIVALLIRAPLRRTLVVAIASGAALFGTTSSWALLFGRHAWMALVVGLTGFWTVAALIASRFRDGPIAWLGVPSAFVLAELARTRFPLGGYGLGLVGYSQVDGPLRTAASMVGAHGLSWATWAIGVVAMTAGRWLWRLTKRARTPSALSVGKRFRWLETSRLAASLLASVVVFALGVPASATLSGTAETWEAQTPSSYASGSLPDVGVSQNFRVVVVQAYDVNRPLTLEEELQGVLLTSLARMSADAASFRPDLVVWPEASLGFRVPESDLLAASTLTEAARTTGAFVLANGQPLVFGEKGFVNRNYLVSPEGRIVGISDKVKLVPFGEYVPARSLLAPIVTSFEKVPLDGQSGKWRSFDLEGVRVGAVVCFESTFGDFVRRVVLAGSDVVVVETNNRSFEMSNMSIQHVSASRMRALETRRFVIHAALSGISAIVAPDGKVIAEAGLFERRVLFADVVPTRSLTFYTRTGDWPIAIASFAFALLGLVGPIGRRDRGQ